MEARSFSLQLCEPDLHRQPGTWGMRELKELPGKALGALGPVGPILTLTPVFSLFLFFFSNELSS